jgi:predicted RNase H-like nuclease (RuvC/YqgF family)
MEIEYEKKIHHADVPTEVIIHYIVKDYQRMFLTYGELERRAEKAEAKIAEMKERHSKAIETRDKEIKELKKEIVSQDRAKQLEKELGQAREQNKLLAQAIASMNTGINPEKLIYKSVVPVDPDRLEKKFGSQVNDAYMKITAAEERLANYQEMLEEAVRQGLDTEQIQPVIEKIRKAFGKIDSAVKHIENFYKLANSEALT